MTPTDTIGANAMFPSLETGLSCPPFFVFQEPMFTIET